MSHRRVPVGLDRMVLELEPLEPRILLDGAPQQQAPQLLNALPAVFVENQGQHAGPSVYDVCSANAANPAAVGPPQAAPDDQGEANQPNMRLAGAPALAAGLPDLFVADVSGPAQMALRGQEAVELYLSNAGSDSSGPFDLCIYLSADQQWDSGDLLVADSSRSSMAPGASMLTEVPVYLNQVSGVSPGTYYWIAYADPGSQVQDSDESNNWSADSTPVVVGSVGRLTSPDGNVSVSVYAVTSMTDVSLSDVAVKWGNGGSVSSISLVGTQSLGGLGIAISGATSVSSIKDARKGALGILAFIASDAPVKSIALKSGMSGCNINGLTLDRLTLAQDIDGDGDIADATAIYAEGAVGKVSFGGNITGDVWIGGSLGSFTSKTGGQLGDLTAMGSAGTISLGHSFSSTMRIQGSLSALQVTGGNFGGRLYVTGGLAKLSVTGGKTGGGGRFCAGADVSIGGMLKSAKITACDTNNGGYGFGIYAGSFGKLTIGTWKVSPSNVPYNQGDFWVDLLV